MSKSLSGLLSLISHEVRGPMGVIRGYLRLLEQQGASLSEPHRQAVAAALRATDRATEVLGQVSTLARLHRGEVAPALSALPLESLVQATVAQLTQSHDASLTVQVGAIPPVSIPADKTLLPNALASIASVLVRAQPGDPRVYVAGERDQRSGDGVVLTIASQESTTPTLVETPLDLSRGGVGLDLPVAAFVIEAHQGRVTERREHNRFVGVVVWLPTA